jgi:hypothetical protein
VAGMSVVSSPQARPLVFLMQGLGRSMP